MLLPDPAGPVTSCTKHLPIVGCVVVLGRLALVRLWTVYLFIYLGIVCINNCYLLPTLVCGLTV